jgi:hypothetical protein
MNTTTAGAAAADAVSAALTELRERIAQLNWNADATRSGEPEQILALEDADELLADPLLRRQVEDFGRLAHVANMRLELRGGRQLGLSALGGSEMLLALTKGSGAVTYVRTTDPRVDRWPS